MYVSSRPHVGHGFFPPTISIFGAGAGRGGGRALPGRVRLAAVAGVPLVLGKVRELPAARGARPPDLRRGGDRDDLHAGRGVHPAVVAVGPVVLLPARPTS